MKKVLSLLLTAGLCAVVQAAGFVEKFEGSDLSPQSWMQTIVDRCKGLDYKKPLNGQLALLGVIDGKAGGNASLERDACGVTGNFRWTLTADLTAPAASEGTYQWRIMSDNGETQLGVGISKNANGKWSLQGICGHTCKTLTDKKVSVAGEAVKIEIIRRGENYQLSCGGKVFYTARGDTAALASIRVTAMGKAPLTVKAMSLENIK